MTSLVTAMSVRAVLLLTSDPAIAQNQVKRWPPGFATFSWRHRTNVESAIVGMLLPGSYTAIVRGFNNAPGNALVEVYA
jgi:hypothetical protein